MIGVAVVVGQVYGRVAGVGVVLLTVSNYQIVGRKIKKISWTDFLPIFVMLANNCYFGVINPSMMGFITAALLFIDKQQVESEKSDLSDKVLDLSNKVSDQNKTIVENEEKLKVAQPKLVAITQALCTLGQSVAEAEAAKAAATEKAEELSVTIQSNIVTNLENVINLLEALTKNSDLKDLIAHERTLRTSMDSMLITYGGICEQLKPLIPKLDKVGIAIDETTSRFEATVQFSNKLIIDLNRAFQMHDDYKRRIV